MNQQQQERFYQFIADYITNLDYGPKDVFKVTSVEEYTEYGGGCSTCYYESTKLRIDYLDSQNMPQQYEYYGSFTDLIGFES